MLLEATLGQVFLSEFAGTAMLLLLGAGVIATNVFNKSKGQNAGWLMIAFGWGMGVFAGVLVAFKSGGHLNPAVTIGKAVAHLGDNTIMLAPDVPVTAGNIAVYIVAQFLGAFVGAALCWLAFKKQFDIEQPSGTKLGVFSTGPATKSPIWNCVTEAIGAFVLVLVILLSGYQGNSGDLGWLNALGVAFLFVAIGVSLGGPTGFAVNPARDLGPRVWHAIMPVKDKGNSDWGYAWVPVVGPVVGAVLAALVYLIFHVVSPMGA